MSLSALLAAQHFPVIEWNSTTIDNVLIQGDKMYLNACHNGLIPREELLFLDNLPTVISFPWLTDKSSNLSKEICRPFIDTNISTFFGAGGHAL